MWDSLIRWNERCQPLEVVHNSVNHYFQMVNTGHYKLVRVRDPLPVTGKLMGCNVVEPKRFT